MINFRITDVILQKKSNTRHNNDQTTLYARVLKTQKNYENLPIRCRKNKS